MVRHLPAESLTGVALNDAAAERELSEEEEATLEAQFWTSDRKLLAHLINEIRQQTITLGHWDAEHPPPKFEPFGPKEWRDESEQAAAPKPERTIQDVLSMFF